MKLTARSRRLALVAACPADVDVSLAQSMDIRRPVPMMTVEIQAHRVSDDELSREGVENGVEYLVFAEWEDRGAPLVFDESESSKSWLRCRRQLIRNAHRALPWS